MGGSRVVSEVSGNLSGFKNWIDLLYFFLAFFNKKQVDDVAWKLVKKPVKKISRSATDIMQREL